MLTSEVSLLNASFGQTVLTSNESLDQIDVSQYLDTLLASAFIFSILSPFTVASNGLLLVAIYKDPFKCFRSPVTVFIISLAMVDLLTGFIVEPLFALHYFACYFKQTLSPGEHFYLLFQIGTFFSLLLLSSSFLLVLALTTTQYIAITFPHKYKIFFTKKRIVIAVVGFFVYFVIFSSLQFAKIPYTLYLKINLHLHPTVVGFLLAVANIVLFRSFRKFEKQSNALRNPVTHHSAKPISRLVGHRSNALKQEKHLTTVALLLSSLLLFCAVPHIVAFYIYLYSSEKSNAFVLNVIIALRVSDLVLFLKVALDAYIYAWRHPKYRKAIKGVMFCFVKKMKRETETELELMVI